MDPSAARRVGRLGAVAWVAALLAGGGAAQADDRWTEPYPGIRHLHRTTDAPFDMHAVVADLGRAELRVIATRPGDRQTITSEFARRHDAQIAINANFYGGSSCGLAMGDGQRWDDSYEDGCTESAGFGRDENRASIFTSRAVQDPPDGWVTEVVSGKPRVVVGGNVVRDYDCNFHICQRHPRTVVGLSEDRRRLILLVVDGRSARSIGMPGSELGQVMVELGAHEAVNLDGGGSTTMFIEAEGGVVNTPSDGRERTVMNHLGIQVRGDRQWWGAELVERSEAPEVRAGGEAELWARYRNTGRSRWRPDGDHPVRLGTHDPRDRVSALFHPDHWISETRAAAVGGEAGPGEEGTFTFRVRAPDRGGVLTESFAPVAEGGGWMDGSPARWDLTVEEPDQPPEPDTGPGPGPDEDAGPPPTPDECRLLEVCNGLDDDCDGVADEGPLLGGVATMRVTVDNEGQVRVNGQPALDHDDWSQSAEVQFHLEPGENVVAVQALDTGGPGGLVAETVLPGGARVGTDARWRVLAGDPPEGWDLPGFDDSEWAPATEHGALGEGPWGDGVAGFAADTPARWIWTADAEADDRVALRWVVHQPDGCVTPGGDVGALRCVAGAVACVGADEPDGPSADAGEAGDSGDPGGGGSAGPPPDGDGDTSGALGCGCRTSGGLPPLTDLLRRR